ncbi:MAG: beta-galactosidase, partial [Clostridia bacterium]|nr:beta-galactosidase [Clostridia bacterium]
MNGANHADRYQPTITSYDYSALLTESGDRTEAYYKIREIIGKYFSGVPEITAKDSEKAAYGKVNLTEKAPLFENLDRLSKPISSPAPRFMEDVGQSYGYILYRSTLKGPWDAWSMSLEPVHDRAHIFVNGELKGVYDRTVPLTSESAVKIPLGFGEKAEIDILVENMGRVNYGPKLRDRKGIESVRFGNTNHFGWEIYPLPMNDLSGLSFAPANGEKDIYGPVFLRGELEISGSPKDTFLRLDGFTKGFVTVNGVNIGRYYNPAGPQKTLYVPAPFLKQGKNEIIVFESDFAVAGEIEFLDKPDLG